MPAGPGCAAAASCRHCRTCIAKPNGICCTIGWSSAGASGVAGAGVPSSGVAGAAGAGVAGAEAISLLSTAVVSETSRFTNNPHCHSATQLYYWLIIPKKKYRTNNEEQYKFNPNYSTTGSKTLPKHNKATTKTPSTTSTKSPIQNIIQHGYHTSNVQRYDRVQTRHSRKITAGKLQKKKIQKQQLKRKLKPSKMTQQLYEYAAYARSERTVQGSTEKCNSQI